MLRAAIAAAAALSASCAEQASVHVRVSEAGSGRPIGGALVRAMPLDAKHPLDIAAALNPASPQGTDARSSREGEATVRTAAGKPVRIYVAAAGFVPWGRLFNTPPAGLEARLEAVPEAAPKPENP